MPDTCVVMTNQPPMNSSGFKGQARQGSNGRGGRRGRETPTQTRSRWQQRRNSGSSAHSQGASTPKAPTPPALSTVGSLPDLLAGLKGKQAFVHINSQDIVGGTLVSYDVSGPLRFDLAVDGEGTIRSFGASDFATLCFESQSAVPVAYGSNSAEGLTPAAAPPRAPTGPAALAAAAPPSSIPTKPSGFRTDTAISGAGAIVERKLEKWQDDDADADALANSLGALDTMTHDGAWDQFAVNKQRFGVETTYDERFYTTEIDQSHPEYRERRRKAEQLARDIMRDQEGNSNAHIAEERGLQVDDSGLDEEDKYSGVDRRGTSDFVAAEAQAAEANPRYYDRERADRRQDVAQFTREYNLGGSPRPPPPHPMMVPPMPAPMAGAMPPMPPMTSPMPMAPAGLSPVLMQGAMPVGPGSSGPGTPRPASGSPGPNAVPATKRPPKTFNFASAAKASFKPISASMPAPPVNSSPVASGTPIPIPGKEPTPSQSPPAKLRSLTGKFDYFAAFKDSEDRPPKPFTTPPSWDSHDGPSYKDQFANVAPAPVAIPVMPYGFYPGYAPPPMFVYEK